MADDGKLTSYLFTVEIDGIETARFQKCEGLEAETYVYEVEEGGMNNTTHKFYGRTRYPNIILEKGVSDNNDLFNWYKRRFVRSANWASPIFWEIFKSSSGRDTTVRITNFRIIDMTTKKTLIFLHCLSSLIINLIIYECTQNSV